MIGKEKFLCKWKCHLLYEKFEDTKVVIRSRKTKKSNNTLAERKRTNNILQNPVVNSGALEGLLAVSAPLVTPTVLTYYWTTRTSSDMEHVLGSSIRK